jgi:carboxyl-terminal processing protease
MKNKALFVSLIILMFTLPVLAGGKGEHKKCTKRVQVCLNDMVNKLKSTGFIGVELDKQGENDPLVVTKVIEGSPAEKAGIQVGDELYAINGIKFSEKNGAAIDKVKVPGNTVKCTVKRNGADKTFKLTLVPMPADLLSKYIGEHMMEHAIETKLAKK